MKFMKYLLGYPPLLGVFIVSNVSLIIDLKILGGGYTFLLFYCIFVKKFCKNFGGRVHFYPSPHHPSPPLCASMSVSVSVSLSLSLSLDLISLRWIQFRRHSHFYSRLVGLPSFAQDFNCQQCLPAYVLFLSLYIKFP
jgi:hypothetical protein